MGLAASVGLLVLAFSGRHVEIHNHYGTLTLVALIASAAALLSGQWAVAGVVVGVGICSKYPHGVAGFGVYAVAAVAVGGWAAAGLLIADALSVVVVVAAMGRRGRHWFVRRAVRNKTTFLEAGRMRPTEGVRRIVGRKAMPRRARSLTLAAHVVMPAAMAMAGVAVVVSPSAGTTVGLALALLALIAWYPRSDSAHVVPASSLSITAVGLVAVAFDVSPDIWPPLTVIALLVVVVFIADLIDRLPGEAGRDVPTFRLVPVVRHHQRWPDETEDLIELTGGEVFLLLANAAMVYAAGEARNPTPFDYPFNTTFGPDGQQEVIRAIQRGEIEHVCKGPGIPPHFQPSELADFVDRAMKPVATCALGRVFVLDGGSSGPAAAG